MNPIFDLVLGALILVIVFVVATGRDTWRRERSAQTRHQDPERAVQMVALVGRGIGGLLS